MHVPPCSRKFGVNLAHINSTNVSRKIGVNLNFFPDKFQKKNLQDPSFSGESLVLRWKTTPHTETGHW